MADLTPEDLFKQWHFQDAFADIAITLVESGAHLGAIALAREIMAAQFANGNRTLRNDELLELIQIQYIPGQTDPALQILAQAF